MRFSLSASSPPLRLLLAIGLAAPASAATVLVADIQGAISPASAAYFERALTQAWDASAELLVVELDTPGCLDTAIP